MAYSDINALNFGLTPVEEHNGVYFKREDLFTYMGMRGAKVRGAKYLINKGLEKGAIGFTTVGHRKSPQIHIVGTICKQIGMPFVGHTPQGELPEAFSKFNIIQHKAGYNNVIAARCHEFALKEKYFEIPFGMEDYNVVCLNETQVLNIPDGVKRIVIPVGSGVNLCGLLRGLRRFTIHIPVVGIVVGKSPLKTLQKYAPFGWQTMVTLIDAGIPYAKEAKTTEFLGVQLDPIYEAKCTPFLKTHDLFWVVGKRTF